MALAFMQGECIALAASTLSKTLVGKLAGVQRVKADYPTETVTVVFDPALTNVEDICAAIARKGYRCTLPDDAEVPRNNFKKLGAVVLGILGVVLLIFLDTKWISQSGSARCQPAHGLRPHSGPGSSDWFSLRRHVRRLCSELYGGRRALETKLPPIASALWRGKNPLLYRHRRHVRTFGRRHRLYADAARRRGRFGRNIF